MWMYRMNLYIENTELMIHFMELSSYSLGYSVTYPIVVWKNILGQTIDYRNAYRREIFFVEKLFLKHIFFYIFIEHKESNLIRFEYPFDSIVIFWQPISLRFWLNPWIYTLCKIIKKKKIIQSFYFSNKKKEEEKCRKVKRKRKFFVISQHKLLAKKLTF